MDADLANNAANWQWVAGCGADAAPFFRIFNPVLQGEKFDPEGAYVRTLRAGTGKGRRTNISIGPGTRPSRLKITPPPIVDLAEGRA